MSSQGVQIKYGMEWKSKKFPWIVLDASSDS